MFEKNGKMDAMKFATDMCDGKAFSEGGIYQTSHCSVMVAYWRIRGGGSKPPICSVMVAY